MKKISHRDTSGKRPARLHYTYAEIRAKDKTQLCFRINNRLRPGERVFSIRHMFMIGSSCYYEVFFESSVSPRLCGKKS